MRLASGVFLLGIILVITGNCPAVAGSSDYVFEVVHTQVHRAANAIISIRLVNKLSGKLVPNAVIFQTRLDMSPDNMADMTTTVTPLTPSEPGVYPFRGDLSMGGRWALKLAAKVPGEQETVRGEVVVAASE